MKAWWWRVRYAFWFWRFSDDINPWRAYHDFAVWVEDEFMEDTPNSLAFHDVQNLAL